MSNVRVSAPSKPKIVPAFVVRKLEGKVPHTIIKYQKLDGEDQPTRQEITVQEDAGWLVMFPVKGNASMRVRTEKELERLGFDQTIELISEADDNDEVLGYMPNPVAAASKSK